MKHGFVVKPLKQPKARKAPPVETGMTFSYVGTVGLPPEEARAKLEAFQAKHLTRPLRKNEKGTAQLVREARDARGRR
jgi:hypothetical protein